MSGFRFAFAAVMIGLAGITMFPSSIGLEKVEIITIALVLLAFLPWLSIFLSEFSAGGITVKLREIEKKIATVAEQQVRTDDQLMQSTTEKQTASQRSPAVKKQAQNLEALAQKYIKIRASLPSSSTRTSKMTDIFMEMRAASKSAGPNWGQEELWLAEDDPGKNLAAVSYLNAFLDKAKPTQLIALVERTSQPFIQYWALRTINSYVQSHGSMNFSSSDTRRLKALERTLGPTVDRGILVRNINRDLLASQNQ